MPDNIVAMMVAVSFSAGLNVPATVATLGLLGRFDVVALPADGHQSAGAPRRPHPNRSRASRSAWARTSSRSV
jgi:beta-phosphoglucomutase-like phosphatase (HAD superfamily)